MPGSRSPRKSAAAALGEWILPRIAPIALAVGFAIVVGVALVSNRNFWLDEAMLYLAIADHSLLPPGEPLTRFSQALPYGSYVILKLVVDAFGATDYLVRLPVMAAYSIGVYLTYRASRKFSGTFASAIATALIVFFSNTVFQGTSFKHYMFEFVVSALILLVGIRLFKKHSKITLLGVLLVSVVGLAFSNTSVLVSAAVLGWLALRALYSGQFRAFFEIAGISVAYVLCFALWYAAVIRPSTAPQLDNPVYSNTESFGLALLALAIPIGTHLRGAIVWAVPVVLLIGLAVLSKRVIIPPTVFVLAIGVGLTAVATWMGVAPFISPRHLTFLGPILAVAYAATLSLFGKALMARFTAGQNQDLARVFARCSAALVISALVVVGVRNAARETEQLEDLMPIATSRCTTASVYYGAQPALEFYDLGNVQTISLLGLRDSKSGTESIGTASWTGRETFNADLPEALPGLRAAEHPCLIFSHSDNSPGSEEQRAVRYFRDNGLSCVVADEATGARLYTC